MQQIHSKSEKLFDVVNYTLLMLFTLVCLYPFVYMLALSFNTGTDTMKGGITIFPRLFTLSNYAAIFRDGIILNAYKITILRTVLGTLVSVFTTGLVAYGLSERTLPGRKIIMSFLLVPMFFGGGLIPYYLSLKSYGLLDTFLVYIIPGIFSIWNCIVMKTFFMQIPESLKESVRIDGGNELQIFFRIIFPTSLPMFAAISLFLAVGHWNDWFTGAYFVSQTDLVPVQTYLQLIMNRTMTSFLEKDATMIIFNQQLTMGLFDFAKTTSFSLKVTAVVVGTAPILILYPFLQKYFVKGVMIGSLKE
jgi:putative aldouronate transport system permease protein